MQSMKLFKEKILQSVCRIVPMKSWVTTSKPIKDGVSLYCFMIVLCCSLACFFIFSPKNYSRMENDFNEAKSGYGSNTCLENFKQIMNWWWNDADKWNQCQCYQRKWSSVLQFQLENNCKQQQQINVHKFQNLSMLLFSCSW